MNATVERLPGLAASTTRAFVAETLKLRGTLLAWMALVAPALVVAVVVLQFQFNPPKNALPEGSAWPLLAQSMQGLWAFLMLPLYVTLQSSLLGAMEHGPQRWRTLLALPLPRGAHYLAKLVMLLVLVLAAHVALALFIAAGGGLLSLLQPAYALDGAPPWALLFSRAATLTAATLGIVALHTFIALRFRNFALACGLGMGATVAGFLVGQSARFGPWYPWSLPVATMARDGALASQVIAWSALLAVLATLAGLAWFRRAEID